MGSDITHLLDRWARGDASAFGALMPIVYDELRRLAEHYLRQERSDHTLQPTALVHEAYLRLAGNQRVQLNSRAHFYGAAAQAMRRVLVDYARQRNAIKRGGANRETLSSTDALDAPVDVDHDLQALDEALQALERAAPDKARVVELRYFGGLSVEETAEYLNIAPATVHRRWAYAKAWLYRWLTPSAPTDSAAR